MDDAERGFQQSLWLNTAGQIKSYPSSTGNISTDVVVIGGGYTGLSSALHLRELGKSVVVLEAHQIGWGASGRNGGQVNPGAKILPSEIDALYGQARGEKILKLLDGACDLVFDLIKRHQIDCAPRRAPYFRAAIGTRGLKEVESWVQEWGAFGAPVTLKNRSETHSLMGSEFFQGGFEDARGGSLQPLSYVRGLAEVAARAGAQIFDKSQATGIERKGADWLITTKNKTQVRAPSLIIATNGYTDDLWPQLRQQVVPVASLQAATEPLPKDILKTILPDGHHFSDTRNAMVYCRIDETGRFQIGGRGSPFSPTVQQRDTKHLQTEAHAIFPQLRDVKWEFEWGGLVAMTRHHMPHLIALGENAFAGMGYNGRGVAMGTAMGKQLAAAVAGEDVLMPMENPNPFALHRFRNLAVGWHMIRGHAMDQIRLPSNRRIF